MKHSVMPRRSFLRLMGVVGSGTILGACSKKKKGAAEGDAGGAGAAEAHDRFPTPEPLVKGGITNVFGRELVSDAAAPEDQMLYESARNPAHLDVARDRYEAAAALAWGTESLLRLDKNWQPQPALAESYSLGPDAQYCDFVIREGAKWSDGTPITADDVVYTYHHLSDPALNNPWVWYFFDIKGLKARWMGVASPEEIGVEALDERTLRIHGEGPAPHLPQMLAVMGTSPIPRHVAEKDPEHWADTADGFLSSGPYKLVSWDPGKSLEWAPNPHYNGPTQPAIERVVQRLDEPENGWFSAWKERKIDLLRDLGFANIRVAQTTAVITQQLHYAYDVHTEYMALNTLASPLDNLKLRQALSQAIDRETFCYDHMNYTRVPAYSMLPPGFPAYGEALSGVQSFDVKRAKELLAEAGYPEGKNAGGAQLELTFSLDGGRQYVGSLRGNWARVHRDKETSEYVVQQWEEHLGIKVSVETLDAQEWARRRSERTLQVYIGSYRFEYRDPANLLSALWRSVDERGSFHHAWVNASFDKLVTGAGGTADAEQRMSAYGAAERVLVEDVGAVFFTHNYIYDMWWPHITGIPLNNDGLQVYRLDRTPYQMYIREDFDKWREQSGTTATGDRHTPPTPVAEE